MKDFPLDSIITELTEKGRDIKEFFTAFLEMKDDIYFFSTLKKIRIELKEFESLILDILKPVIDYQTKIAKEENSYLPSKILKRKDNNEPVTLPGYRDEYKRQFMFIAYMGLYHKIENAEKEILRHYNKAQKTNKKDLSEIEFENTDKVLFKARDRIRVVANCFKHNIAIANKQVCSYYPSQMIDKEIHLGFDDFKEDMDDIRSYYDMLSIHVISVKTSYVLKQIPDSAYEFIEGGEDLKKRIDDSIDAFDKIKKHIKGNGTLE